MKTGDQIVQELPWNWGVQGKVFLIGGLGYMFDAWDVALNGFLTPLLALDFGLSDGEKSLVATANLIGMALGAVTWGSIADRLGRRKAFSVTLLVFAIFSVLGAFSPTFGFFLAMRFLAGVGLGGCIPVDYALVSEFSPRKVRGKVLTALDLWWPIGATFAGLASVSLLNVDNNWRWMLIMMVLPALLVFFVRRGIPESPVYLARTGREAEARLVIDDLVRRCGATPEPYAILAPPAERPRGVAAAVDQFRSIWGGYPRITVAAWLLFISIMVVYYAALSWMPTILKDAGFGSNGAFVGTTLMSGVGILGCIASALLVERTGRKWLLGVSAPAASVALVVFGLALDVPTRAMVMVAVFGFFIQVAIPVLYAYAAELYPTEIRASGFAWASSMSRVATGLAPIAFASFLWPTFGLTNTFVILACMVGVAVAAMAFLAPETRDRELDEDDVLVAAPAAKV